MAYSGLLPACPRSHWKLPSGKTATLDLFNESASGSGRAGMSSNCNSRCALMENQPIEVLTTYVTKQSYAQTEVENTPLDVAGSGCASTLVHKNNFQGV